MDRGEHVRLFLEGDPSTLARIRRYIVHVVRSFHARDGEVPSDLVQEILGRLIANLRAGRFQGDSSLETYAQSVARYTCIDARRQRRIEAPIDADTLPSAASWSRPEDWLIRSEAYRAHLIAFHSLDAESRELLQLVFVEKRTYREVAETLGISEGALKSRIHRCRVALRAAAQAVGAREDS